MTAKRRVKIVYIVILLIGAASVLGLILYALRQNIDLYYTPTELLAIKNVPKHQIRIGGMVREQSVQKMHDLRVRFVVTDFNNDVQVEYDGILPDLFKEGQGVVAMGRLSDNNVFVANQILAKHDQNYMPPR